MTKQQLKELISRAILVAHWRDRDVDTEDGAYATTDTDEMIHLESSIQDGFNGMEANDLICTGSVERYIDNAISDISQQELINELTEKLEKAMVAFRNQVELKIVHPNHRKETEDLADELLKTITKAKGDKQ